MCGRPSNRAVVLPHREKLVETRSPYFNCKILREERERLVPECTRAYIRFSRYIRESIPIPRNGTATMTAIEREKERERERFSRKIVFLPSARTLTFSSRRVL